MTPALNCTEEIELLRLLKETHQILSDVLGGLCGTTPPTHESSYLCTTADAVCIAAEGYLLLRESGHVNASKLLIRPMVEAALFATAVSKQKGFYYQKRYSELLEEGKLHGNTIEVRARVQQVADDLATALRNTDLNYPIRKAEITIYDAARAAGLEQVYQVFYRLYCQYTHNSKIATCGQLDALTDPHDTFLAAWCVWQTLVQLPQHISAKLPSLTSLEDRFNRANPDMLTAFGAGEISEPLQGNKR